ncbi:MAG: APC family permease [Ktedonobacteraceae bacterium]
MDSPENMENVEQSGGKESIKNPADTSNEPTAAYQRNILRPGTLRTWDAFAQSIALLALAMGVALSTSFAAQFAGAAAPLAYLITGLGSLCLAYIIIRFTRRMASAGSLYTYISYGLGPGVGFIGGWLYAGAFAVGIAFTMAISSIYLQGVLANLQINLDWFVLFCVLLVVLFLFAFFSVRIATRVQLVLAGLGALSIVILAIIIIAKGGANGLSLTPLSPAALPGGFSGLFFATVFSFTSFIGFEAAAVLGEETVKPRVTIPLAILVAIIVGIIFYVLVSYAFSVGYGVAHADKWAADQTVLDTLAHRYTNTTFATFIDFMVAIDAFVASLAGLNLTSRILFAMGRDRGIPTIFGLTHPRYKTPWVGIVTALVITLILGATLGRNLGPFNFFGFLATTASLAILVAYILVALSGIVFFLRSRESKGFVLVVDIVLPIIAILLCGATIYSSVIPVPPPPLDLAPYIVGIWLLLGIVLLVVLWVTNRENVRKFGRLLAE